MAANILAQLLLSIDETSIPFIREQLDKVKGIIDDIEP
jgi:hypothetical protein